MAMKAEIEHLRQSLVACPMIEGDAVRSDENTGPILSKLAMNENFLHWRLTQNEKNSASCPEVGVENPSTGIEIK